MSQHLDLSQYKTLIFDCDGVILNSNKIKTNAFYSIAEPFGPTYAEELTQYHISNGGISRYEKINYFITVILGRRFDDNLYKMLLDKFSFEVMSRLLKCEIAEGLPQLKALTGRVDG